MQVIRSTYRQAVRTAFWEPKVGSAMQEKRRRPEHTAELPPFLNRVEAFVCRPAVFSVPAQRHKKSRRTCCARLLTLLLYHLEAPRRYVAS
jgi:hypothetical protein